MEQTISGRETFHSLILAITYMKEDYLCDYDSFGLKAKEF